MPLDWSANLGADLTAWVYPVQRSTAEGLSLLTVVIERPADGGPSSAGFMQNLSFGANIKPTGFVLVDIAAGTAATPLRMGESWAASSDTTEIAAGSSLTATVAFPAVSAGAATVQVMLPGFDLVEVPVVEQDSSTWPEDARQWAGSPAKTGAFAPVESSALSLVTQSTVEVAGDQVVVDLPADVLFAFNRSALSTKAQKVVDKAGRKIAEAAAESGEITVVGHTDDQGTASDNAKLSKARAEAVADRLRPILGSGFTVKTEGKGSTEPTAKGTSEEARAANRRVEIEFTGRSANKLVVVDDVPTELPATTGVVVSGMEVAHVPASILNPELDARMVSLRRSGTKLVGVLEIATPNVRAESAALFGDTTLQRRGFENRQFDNLSIANVNLLSATLRTFSSSFRPGGDQAASPRLVGSDAAPILPVPGGPRRYVLVWPDADPSATTVTVDAPDAYRFLDVPIG
ncbi:OmpA family protein [Sanguibacter sp. HDW7]|uniref:OmpA family protein n=1 Tax=Sanguibacter sp. HDW7 TaxID=2714931 RepID=UPI00140A91FC|nr:OmpA family protein [Sanguibacter sp. HDW7]QIK82708.1 OmpA family protein [Sanguibacter sp. HDW7]